MPKILDDCVESMKRRGISEASAFAICTKRLQQAGILKKGTRELTAKGKRENRKRR